MPEKSNHSFGTIWHGKSWATRREDGISGQSCQKSRHPFFVWHDYAINMNEYAIGARISNVFEEFKSWFRNGEKVDNKGQQTSTQTT